MTKLALIGLITVCITVLCFTLLRHERLCSFNISSGNTLVQAIYLAINSFVGGIFPQFTRQRCCALCSQAPYFKYSYHLHSILVFYIKISHKCILM
ncbi:Hok/Gef family protein [Proteus mirabilis]